MKILLTGASGFIGRNLTALLERDGHQILPISRRHGFDIAKMRSIGPWLPLLHDIDAVVNAAGIIGETRNQGFHALHAQAPQALFDACVQAKVRRIVQISALGADDTAFSAYHLSKKAADDYLRQLAVDWFVLRPSLIYGRGGTSAELFMRIARLPMLPVVGDGAQALQPVHIADVVMTIAHCLTSAASRQTLDIVGNETVSYIEWLQRLRLAQGLERARVLPLPARLVMAATRLGHAFSPLLRTENICMLVRGYRADGDHWRRFLGRAAMDFRPELLLADAAQAIPSYRRTS